MAEAALSPEFYTQAINLDERVLTEVDHVLGRLERGQTLDQSFLDDELLNLTTAVQEAAMPFAVSETRHEVIVDYETGKKTPMWLGRTAIQAAMSGYKYHNHKAALARVDVEIDEARYSTNDHEVGVAKVLISPRMTRVDASLDDARREHLADDDAVRVSWYETDEEEKVTSRVMKSLLIRDIPYEAWVSMLGSEDNIFGKSIDVDDDGSALSVMKVHRELELPIGELKDGPIDIVESVIPYIEDPAVRRSVIEQVKLFRGDQEDMRKIAEAKAEQWLEFEISLAQSLHEGRANFEVERFIVGLQEYWGTKELNTIGQHELTGGGYRMSRKLAIILEKAKQNTLWSGAASMVVNPEVADQVSPVVLNQIKQNESHIQIARQNGMDYFKLEADNNRLIAGEKIKVGGGCSGKSEDAFGNKSRVDGSSEKETVTSNNSDNKENWKYKQGICRVKSCAKKTEVGPCSVCRSCQAKFDKGIDPTNELPARPEKEVIAQEQRLAKDIWSFINRSEIVDEPREIISNEKIEKQSNPNINNSLVSV